MWREIIHDPSQFVRRANGTLVFSTSGTKGVGLRMWELDETSGEYTEKKPLLEDDAPAWTRRVQKWNDTGEFDAPAMPTPDIIYYTVYDENELDIHDYIGRAHYNGKEWIDDGIVIFSEGEGNHPRAMDPAIFDDFSGQPWMVFGSHAGGIYVTRLNPVTGLLAQRPKDTWSSGGDDQRFNHVASGLYIEEENIIEAPYIFPHNDWYYLFVNWGSCCSGSNSSYNIRIGRSRRPQGPYLDQKGRDLRDQGGSIFLSSNGDERGPGHAGIVEAEAGSGSQHLFSYHYYDAATGGTSRLGLRELGWVDDWPVLGSIKPTKRVNQLSRDTSIGKQPSVPSSQASSESKASIELNNQDHNETRATQAGRIKGRDTGNKSDKIVGSSKDDRIRFGRGPDRLSGGPGADSFVLKRSDKFNKKGADKIMDFDPTEGDVLLLSQKALPMLDDIELDISYTKRDLNNLLRGYTHLIYHQPKGFLYYNENEDLNGCGKHGGLLAIFKGSPELNEHHIDFI